MSPETPIRLEFERPPLIEQAISVAFEPPADFSIVDYGLFWEEIAEAFPLVTSDMPLENPVEMFNELRPSNVTFSLLSAPIMPRVMFRNEAGELVQVQPNRFGFNWAKEGGVDYPHSEAVMARFVELYRQFEAYIAKRQIGELKLQQCELTNLNVIPVSDFGRDYGDVSRALKIDTLDLGLNFLKAETYIRNRQHRILGEDGTPLGRLHTSISPVVSNADHSHAFRLEFTARSAPNLTTFEAAQNFFAIARNSINGAFNALVTDEMKALWKERT